MSDLVDRLRDRAYSGKIVDRLCEEAADAIAQLRFTPQGGSDMNDLVTILRDISHDEKVEDDIRQVCFDGSREIARLRLTATERAAVEAAARDYGDNDMDAGCWQIANALRGLLDRMK